MDVIEEGTIPIEDEEGKIFVIHAAYYVTKGERLPLLSNGSICLLQEQRSLFKMMV